jgi:homogentisate 1,2-dioxygenase
MRPNPIRWSDPRLMYSGIDAGALRPSDATDPAGSPLVLLRGDGIEVSLSQRSEPMPFAEKDVGFHQIRFYHRGGARLETELGPLEVGEGDFVVIPKGLVYRETPAASESLVVFIFAVDANVLLAEQLWDGVGFSSFLTDYSTMELPMPAEHPETEVEVETDVRVRYRGAHHAVTYDFDPCKDVVGWLGDPVIFKMNIWDTPAPEGSYGAPSHQND